MKTWFDLSDIYNWEGNFTGIQRVVFNLAQRFEQSEQDVQFFVLFGKDFNKVTFSDLEKRLANSKVNTPQEEDGLKLLTRSKIILSKSRHHTMVSLKKLAKKNRYSKQLKVIYKNVRSKYWSAKSVLGGSARITYKKLPFQKDDIVLVTGGNWQIEGYADTLAKARKETGFKLVHFIQDLIAIENPVMTHPSANKALTDYFSIIIPNSDVIIAISESTKRDIESFIKRDKLTSPSKIKVIRLGDDYSDKDKTKAVKPSIAIPEKFVLNVGTIEIRKNHRLIYYAYKLAAQKGIDLPTTVLAGKKGWQIEETYSLLQDDPTIKEKIVLANGVSDEELKWLYENCMFTTLPTMYEGWGLTVAESLHYGKPCISGNTSSMPEIADGRLVKFISPFDSNEFMEAMHEYSKEDIRKKQIEYIKVNYKETSWNDTFKNLVDIIGSLA